MELLVHHVVPAGNVATTFLSEDTDKFELVCMPNIWRFWHKAFFHSLIYLVQFFLKKNKIIFDTFIKHLDLQRHFRIINMDTLML